MKALVKIPILILCLIFFFACQKSNTINLEGTWQVTLDAENDQIKDDPNFKSKGEASLPSSLAEAGFGVKTSGSDFGILTPEYKYIGKAWYEKEITIPSSWKGKNVELFLERVLWESKVFIDGKELSVQDALGTPHVHQLGKLKPGSHKLAVQVDNEMIHNIGDKGHGYGEYTQSIWNGIVGKMELRAKDELKILSLRAFPDIKKDKLKVEVEFFSPISMETSLELSISEINSSKSLISSITTQKLQKGKNKVIAEINLDGKLKLWSEFTPNVYNLVCTIKDENLIGSEETEFGFYEVSHDGTKILINGKPVFLRGNLDCVHFPLTGYPSCNVEDWIKIFKTYKAYGLNHARFHSWCPPEAAFKAASRVGIYLQAEASIWIDWWMSTDMIERGRPEMDTKGHPKGLGYDAVRDSFVVAEMNRVVDTYGNHPSFTMFCIGNELGNSDFDVMEQWLADIKRNDPRRLYAVSTARKIMGVDDYSATHYIQGVGRTRGLNGAKTNWDFEETYSKMNIPIIAHEIGQWPVYPKWSEIGKYSGVLKARNFEEFKAVAEKNGVADQDEEFRQASGALNQLMYKYETESFFRTPSCAGVQLLSIQDYQGQGEALIGWLDAHWQSKGITTPEKFREHYTTTVPVLRMEKFVWQNNEKFNAVAELSHHGQYDLEAGCTWKIVDESGNSLKEEKFGVNDFKIGTLTTLGDVDFNLGSIKKAQKLCVEIDVLETEFHNEWEFWVYPTELTTEISDVIIANKLTDDVLKELEEGAKVLLNASGLGTDLTSVKMNFYPLYWSLTFFPGQGKTNIGMLVKNEHPAFNGFPTDGHSNWQWETIFGNGKGFILNQMPVEYKPIAQPVDDFHRNNKVGSIFELKVGKGKLLVCGFDIENEELPVAKQLKYSLVNYVGSPEFNPEQEVDADWLKLVFETVELAKDAELPSEFKGALLYIEAAKLLQVSNENVAWDKKFDKSTLGKGVDYAVNADGVWKDKDGTAWHGNEMELIIQVPDGILGEVYVHFQDSNRKNREGLLTFEGRKLKLGRHANEGKWIKFHVMREDSNDGEIVLKTKATNGGNLMIDKLVLIKE